MSVKSNRAKQDNSALLVACPHCGKEHQWNSSNRYRPFCSERCKMIDLGKWASEEYRVAQATDKEEQDLAGPPYQA